MPEACMPDPVTKEGGCHCGRVRFRAAGDFSLAVECNCSICSKRGVIWSFVKPAQFTLLSGDDAFSDYQFGRKVIHHLFCRSCGVGSFSRGRAPTGEEMIAINLRCLDDVDVSALSPAKFDGKSL
jgi:hypothetical protein